MAPRTVPVDLTQDDLHALLEALSASEGTRDPDAHVKLRRKLTLPLMRLQSVTLVGGQQHGA